VQVSKLPDHIPPATLRQRALHPLIADVINQEEIDTVVSPPRLDELLDYIVHFFGNLWLCGFVIKRHHPVEAAKSPH
jgi:hypothetical protein